MVERCVRDAEAVGSSPVASTRKREIPRGIGRIQLYLPSASYIASQLYLACAKLYCPLGSLGSEYNITAA